MGNKKKDHDGELFDMLRATGLRRKVARTVSKSTARANGGQSSDQDRQIRVVVDRKADHHEFYRLGRRMRRLAGPLYRG